MWFVFALVLVILGMLLLALSGIFGIFPDKWEWVGIGLGALGLAMATPSIFQMRYGAPRIKVDFGVDEIGDGYYLSCNIMNEPISSRLLKLLGVRRDALQDMVAHFEILEQQTDKPICPLTSVKIRTQQGVMFERVSLPVSPIPVKFAIVDFTRNSSEVRVMKESRQFLPIGGYIAKIELLTSEGLERRRHSFTVQDEYPFAYWTKS